MRAFWKAAALQLGLISAFERLAAACPFCGGKGASGLLGNLLVVAGLWFGGRALMRAMTRGQARERSPAPESADDPSDSAPRTAS